MASKSQKSVKPKIPENGVKNAQIQQKGYAIFAVGDEWYCVDIDSIYEILHDFTITPVSHLAGIFEGIINLRGESIPVVNLRNLLNLKGSNTNYQVCIISINNGIKTGFLVDSDIEIIRSTEVSCFPLPDCFNSEEQKFLEGIIEHKNRLIGIIRFKDALDILTKRRLE